MTHIVILPLDDRPVNYDYPRLLAAIAGVEVELPPREWLGNPWRGSQHEKLVEWLKTNRIISGCGHRRGGYPGVWRIDPFQVIS